MPWTFAHPAAVLPLRRLGPLRLDLAALVIGSITPDLGYYAFNFNGTPFAHSFTGSLTLCPLLGLVLLACFHLLRRPVCHLLPQPHREVLMPLAANPSQWGVAAIAVAVVCIIIGAWTHIVWDAFTHEHRWFVDRIYWLQLEVVSFRGHVLHGYSLLQYLSSALGAAVLLWAYWRWLRRATAGRPLRFFEREDAWRYACIAAAMVVAVLIAVPWGITVATRPDGLFDLRVFVVRVIVGTTSLFVAAFVVLALIIHWRRARLGQGRTEAAS